MRFVFQAFPLILTTTVFSSLAYFFANEYSMNLSLFEYWPNRVIFFPILFLLCFALVGLIESMFVMSDFINNESGQVNIRALWRASIFRLNPTSGIVASILMGIGIVGCASLTEIYRSINKIWYDGNLWEVEEPLFQMLIGSRIDVPLFWDHIYVSLWPFVFIAMAIVFRTCTIALFFRVALAVVIAFYITRCLNLLYPTAGPAFYNKELFDLAGTHCAEVQEILRLYMAGQVDQNGLMPGTMAMPSLHVGLMGIAVWRLARIWIWSLLLTAPFFMLVWMSTVMLGWHYALDGIGGIIVMAISMALARMIDYLWHKVGGKVFFSRGIMG